MAELSLYWDPDEDLEDVRQFKPGGSPEKRYRILHKLGHGAFATVWFAEALHLSPQRYFALKVCTSRSDPRHELEIFARLSQNGPCHVVQLLDSFTLQGPNGTHTVLVHDVLGSLSDVVRLPSGRKQVKSLCRQMAEGLAFMHRHGVAHGDIHSRNIGVALSTLSDHSAGDVLDYFGNPECTIVLPTQPPSDPASLPPYVVRPASMLDYLANNDPTFAETPLQAQIMDPGSALVVNEQSRPSCTPAAVCAPELMFERVVRSADPTPTFASDVWSLACTMYEVVFGSTLFRWASANDAMLGRMAVLCGEVPLAWREYWESCEALRKLTVSQEAADAEWAERLEHLMKNVLKTHDDAVDRDARQLVALLRSMLRMDPSARPSAEEALRYPWFALEEASS